MTQEEILQAFDNRWRYKTSELKFNVEHMVTEALMACIKAHCRDFFEAGIALSCPTDPTDPNPPKKPFTPHAEIVQSDLLPDGSMTPWQKVDPFDYFWNLYDKKVGKPKCQKLWDKLTEKEKAECLAYIPRYKEAQPDKQYRKNPETFLRNKSWNDELIYRNNESVKPSLEQQRLSKLADVLTD